MGPATLGVHPDAATLGRPPALSAVRCVYPSMNPRAWQPWQGSAPRLLLADIKRPLVCPVSGRNCVSMAPRSASIGFPMHVCRGVERTIAGSRKHATRCNSRRACQPVGERSEPPGATRGVLTAFLRGKEAESTCPLPACIAVRARPISQLRRRARRSDAATEEKPRRDAALHEGSRRQVVHDRDGKP